MQSQPPKLARKLLHLLVSDDIWKTTLGDFEEYYLYLLEKSGKAKADRWYWQQTLQYAPSKISHKAYWAIEMFVNYLKIALRNILKYKSYSFINIFGLTIGLTSFILLGLYVHFELSYDDFHANSDRTYRINAFQPTNEYLGSNWYAVTPTAMAATLKEDFAEVKYAGYFSGTTSLISNNGKNFNEWGVAADGDFFNIFTYTWFAGNSETALTNPNSIILTASLANKLFGSENAIGKSVQQTYNTGKEVTKTVTGIIADPPKNSHFSFQYVVNDQTTPYYRYNLDEWSNTNVHTYVTLREGVSKEEFEAKLVDFTNTYIAATNYYQNNPAGIPIHSLQALADIHLHSSHINFNPSTPGNLRSVYMLSVIAIIILLIACVNYMNLSTARSLTRAKEVGVRKVNGAFRSNLMMQFISEAVVISFISILFSFFIMAVSLPIFSELMGRELNLNLFLDWKFLALKITISLIVGIASGSYPAFYMSKLKPALILKSQVKGGKGNLFLRNILVVSQFAITIVLIIGSLVVYQQLDFLRSTDTGLNREQIISVANRDTELWDQFETVKSTLLNNSSILEVSASQMNPVYMSSRTSGTTWEGQQDGQELNIYVSPVDYDFIELFDLQVIAGRSFSKAQFNESDADYIVNEAALHELGWTSEEALGKRFNVWGNEGKVVGIVKDFNFQSLYQEITPLAIMLAPQYDHRYALVKVSDTNLKETLGFLETTFDTFSPDYPFSYSFLDDAYDNLYQADIRLGKIFNSFTLLALIIACLGLLGLASFMMEQRTKEIGIRKILGAGPVQILTMLNQDFLKLVAISFVIASPIGWIFAQNWLQDFAYKITPGPLVFITTAALAFGISLLTVSMKSLQVVRSNPVDSLKSE